ncbi:hypothetical protein [Pseudomonas prosekii]|uniref:hypothetical protein n=1 Tax=Pseudomonas prosekii TaxID=1148509 RepID=UPI003F75634E
MELEDVASIVAIATEAGASEPAKKRTLKADSPIKLPPMDPHQGTEIIEALFLEERAPIVVFDAERPELLTLRILTALWPGFRRHFAVSTFCRSPRTIGRRNFDLVFAPKDARSRFSDWPGRRVDGRKREVARHPWSTSIVERVLVSPLPSLKMLDALGEMSSDGVGTETALRVSLLWEDLQRKVYTSPNAVLGLLDIASTRSVRNANVIRDLEPALINSANMAVSKMPAADAWYFLSALVSKLDTLKPPPTIAQSIKLAAADLASKDPGEAVRYVSKLLSQPSPSKPILGGAGDGLAKSFSPHVAEKLSELKTSDLFKLTTESFDLMKKAVAEDSKLPDMLASAISQYTHRISIQLRQLLMPLLTEDVHAELARVVLKDVGKSDLENHLTHLYRTNGLSSAQMRDVLVECVNALGIRESVRDIVSGMVPSSHIDSLMKELVGCERSDLIWILGSRELDERQRTDYLCSLLISVTPTYFDRLHITFAEIQTFFSILNLKEKTHTKLLSSIIRDVDLPRDERLKLMFALLPSLSDHDAVDFALNAIDIGLQASEGEITSKKLILLLNKAGNSLDGNRVFKLGLHAVLSSKVVTRNMEALIQCKVDARRRLLDAVEELAIQLTKRPFMDLSQGAAEGAASLLWESRNTYSKGPVKAAAHLLPFLLEQTQATVSPLISAVFPIVYGELAQESPPDFFSTIFSFVDWDKCKLARRSLAHTFMRSKWSIVDIAIAAARAGDTKLILEQVAKEPGGAKILRTLNSEIESIPLQHKMAVKYALAQIAGF